MTNALDKVLAAQLPIIAPKPGKKAAAKKPAAKKGPAKKVAAKKAVPAKKAAAKKVAKPEAKPARTGTKAEKAETIYLSGIKAGKTRAEILAAFQEHAELTDAGSKTYYANFKKKHGN